ncbi:hypothetical protein T02_2955 [Trichinella nativa]|uniref:Uncharacterized protein n=4 Tax=Trichinella TaxID=6333 RepID=A0A0V1A038_9BILA|nr:hypothetical protein T05_9433 [Trichinella murrelli]KRX55476.1 hypothetical protein T09_484 [Trichinella sp. T9]KRX80204.1 hypothetical protein T06_10009 [Trichinella sp. T6]KRY18147.1 hypothetical protein T12_16935 [Trichinella patagoniensis]KRY50229.1 hypothetical protein T03_10429 [Trichinella britovi]KRZ60983.1 hypothetical protein T02_2955 [Trichinella nativa]KRZ90203.1 hypothetical protein T08_10522 [Trichinella sp. T8]
MNERARIPGSKLRNAVGTPLVKNAPLRPGGMFSTGALFWHEPWPIVSYNKSGEKPLADHCPTTI